MTYTVQSRESAIRTAAEMAAEGEDTRYLASQQTAYSDEIAEVTRLVHDDGVDIEEAVTIVLNAE